MDARASGSGGTSIASAAAPLALDAAPQDASRHGRWKVGTLSYTTAGLALVIFWLLVGDVGISIRDRSYGSGFSLLLGKLKASNTALSFLMVVLPQGISLIFGPLISFKSDRLRSRWGRRIPFLLIAAPVGSLAMIGIAFTPRLGAQLHALLGPHSPGKTWSALLVFGFFWTFFQLSLVCGASLMSALANDVIPRPVLGRFFGMFRGVSLICGMIYNAMILGQVESHFQMIFIGIAVAFGVAVVVMCLMVKEGQYPPPEDAPDDFRAGGFIGSVAMYFRECFSQPYYLWVFAALALGTLTGMPVNTFSVWYAKSLGLDMNTYGRWLATNHFCGFLLAYPLGALVDRFHPLRMSMLTIGLYGITMLLCGMLISGPRSLGISVFFQALISGTYLTTSASLGPVLLPRGKFAQFFSASALLTSIALICSSFALGYALDHTGSNYRLTYFAGFALAMVTVAVMAVVHHKFMALGGPAGYVAPEVVDAG